MASGRYTLLEIVQQVAESLNFDDINSISDSPDAEQITKIAEATYYELLNQKEWPHTIQLTQLESIADADHPNYLRIPDAVARIEEFKYDNTELLGAAPDLIQIETVEYCLPKDFLTLTQSRNTERSEVTTITDFNGVRYHILTDVGPQYWTSFDDEYVVTDAINLGEDSVLQTSKSQVLAKVIPDLTIADSTVADVPVHFFQLWLNETISTASVYMKQEVSSKAEQKARRGLAVLRRDASRTEWNDGKVRYGRPARGIQWTSK
jgi:hypothetical protein